MGKRSVTFSIESVLNKSNIIKSSSFHMDAGDILHIIYKDHTGALITIALVDAGGKVEVIQVIPTTTSAPTTTVFVTTTTPEPESRSGYGALYNWYAATYSDGGDIVYGALYNWYAVDTGMLAASGWRVGTRDDYTTLMRYLDPDGTAYVNDAGKYLKETGTTYWLDPNTGATNSTNFNARGAGLRNQSSGVFDNINDLCWFWNTSDYGTQGGVSWLYHDSEALSTRYSYQSVAYEKSGGLSVRLVRDATEAEQLLADGTACDDYIGNDGKVYPTVKIGTQVWLAANLAETLYNDSSPIPVVTDNAEWAALVTGAMCYYDNDIDNALEELVGIAPTGWHIPTNDEIDELIATIGGEDNGGDLKEDNATYWNTPNINATDLYGFSARGAGVRWVDLDLSTVGYILIREWLYAWCQDEETGNPEDWASCFGFNNLDGYFSAASTDGLGRTKKSGCSIRCIKDDSVDPGIVVDYDGNIYDTVTIGSQVWMVQNLMVTHYSDGTAIPNVTDDEEWKALSTGAYCWYDNDIDNGITADSTEITADSTIITGDTV